MKHPLNSSVLSCRNKEVSLLLQCPLSTLVNWSYRSRSLVNADQGHPGTQQNQASDCQLARCPEGTVTPVDPCGVEVEWGSAK